MELKFDYIIETDIKIIGFIHEELLIAAKKRIELYLLKGLEDGFLQINQEK